MKIIALPLISLVILGATGFAMIRNQNKLTEIRKQIPKEAVALLEVREKNATLRYEIDRFENHLQLKEKGSAFSHLYFPKLDKIVWVYEE